MKHIVFALLLGMAFSAYSGFRSASDEDYAADFVNSLGMKFVTIPAGSFYMGSCKLSSADEEENKKRQFMGLSPRAASCPSGAGSDSDASDDETPQHLVKISRAFQMGVHEVTLGQFKQFIAGAGRGNLLSEDFMKYNNQGDNAPVVRYRGMMRKTLSLG